MIYSLNSGATYSDGRLFVFGKSCEILDSTNGKTLWSFDDRGVHRFPVVLDRFQEGDEPMGEPKEPASAVSAQSRASAMISSPYARPGMTALAQPAATFVDHEDDLMSRMKQLKPFLQGEGALVAPAVQWNGYRTLGQTAADARIVGNRLLLMGVEGIREISLALPVGAHRFSINGILLGVAGDSVWLLEGNVLTQLGLTDGLKREVKIDSQSRNIGEIRAVMSGSRIYVSHAQGLTVLNAHSGKVIGKNSWPDLMMDYMAKGRGGIGQDAEHQVAAWQGYVRSAPGRSAYCFPLRNRVQGDRLYTMVDESSFVMLRGRRVVPANN